MARVLRAKRVLEKSKLKFIRGGSWAELSLWVTTSHILTDLPLHLVLLASDHPMPKSDALDSVGRPHTPISYTLHLYEFVYVLSTLKYLVSVLGSISIPSFNIFGNDFCS